MVALYTLLTLFALSALPTSLPMPAVTEPLATLTGGTALAAITTNKVPVTLTVAGQPIRTNTAGLTVNSCPKYYVIEAPGLGDKRGYWTGPTTAGILAGLSGGQRYTLNTDPPPDNGVATGQQMVTQAAQGSAEIVRIVAQRSAQCPDVKFVLFGYSYGSIELTLALNNPALLRPQIAAVLFYGNCFWHANQEGDRGTATSGTSSCGGAVGPGTPILYQDITADFCLVNDYLCTGTPYCARGTKNCVNSHWDYRDSKWQDQAVAFAIQQLKASGV